MKAIADKGDLLMKNTDTQDIRLISMGEKILQSIMALAVFIAFMILAAGIPAGAAENQSVSICSIDYERSTITVQLAADDTMLYMSDAKMSKWEYVPIAKDALNRVTLDISWISLAKNYVLTFKGDVSTQPVKVTIPRQVTNLSAVYNTYTGTVNFKNVPAGRTVQWKKKEAMNWNDYDETVFAKQLSTMIGNGASLLFRIKAINGDGTGEGARASKEITLNIPKKIAAPVIMVNDDFITVGVVKGMEYRQCDKYGNPINFMHSDGNMSKEWVEITKTENLPVSKLAPDAMADPEAGTDGTQVFLQFRTGRTSSAQVSNTATVRIPGQKLMTDEEKDGIKLVYTSSSTFSLRIPFASSKYHYEYCVINQDDVDAGITIDSIEKLVWKEVVSSEDVKLCKDSDKDDIGDGSMIYVRKAAYLTLGNADYMLATPSICLTSGGIKYPGDISTGNGKEGTVWLQTVAGVCNKSNPEGYISFTLYSPTESIISKLRFVDYAATGTERGVLTLSNGDFKSTVEKVATPVDDDHKYLITTTIMTTAVLDKYAENEGMTDRRKMLVYITLENSTEEYESTPGRGIGFYIHPATKVNNPSGVMAEADCNEIANRLGWTDYNFAKDKVGFTDTIVRMVGSNRFYDADDTQRSRDGFWDAAQFRIRLDTGTRYNPAGNTAGELCTTEDKKVSVIKLKYDGVEFTPGEKGTDSAFYVEYADITGNTATGGEPERMAVITINANVIEKDNRIDDRNTATPVIIYLSNGEILKSQLTMNLQETATIDGGSNSWTITEGTLTESDTTTTTTQAGSSSTTTTVHVDRSIVLKEFEGLNNVSLVSVTWSDGIRDYSICTNINHSNHVYTMDLSNKELNKIDVSTTVSNYLVFTFDNGFKITTGWKLTINPSAQAK